MVEPCVSNVINQRLLMVLETKNMNKEPIQVSDWSQVYKLVMMLMFMIGITGISFRILYLLEQIVINTQ